MLAREFDRMSKCSRAAESVKNELTEQIIMLAREIGRTPTAVEFDNDPRTESVATVEAYFGSWPNLVKVAGFTIKEMD